MDNTPTNGSQTYYWSHGQVQDSMFPTSGYYSVHSSNTPLPNFSQPPPRYPTISPSPSSHQLHKHKPMDSIPQFQPKVPPPTTIAYPNMQISQCSQYPYMDQSTVQTYSNMQSYPASNYSYSTSTNYTSNWNSNIPAKCQNVSTYSHNVNTYVHRSSVSHSPSNRTSSNCVKPSYRSRYDNHKDGYSRSGSRDRGSKDSRHRSRDRHSRERKRSRDRQTWYRKQESSSYRSDSSSSANKSYTDRTKGKRRSKSRESQCSRQSTPNHNAQNIVKTKILSEREVLLERYRRNYCATSKDIVKKMDELSALGLEGIIENERKIWTRTAPADLYYTRDENNPKIMRSTNKLQDLCEIFKKLLIERAASVKAEQPPYQPPPRKTRARLCRHKSEACSSSSSDSESSMDEDDRTMEELMAKKQHPQRLHPEMWFNDPGEMNDGPLCRCSAKSRRSGIRHGIYVGEGEINNCDLDSNNADKLYHYRITISPPTNFLTKTPTIIKHDEHEFIFEGFSMLSHFPLVKLPTCKVIRFNIEYTILYIDEKLPENFTIRELNYFQEYLFKEVLELVDFDLHAAQNKSGCGQFHFMPRFVRDLLDNGQEILSMNEVLNYLIKSSTPLIEEEDLPRLIKMPQYKWQNFADEVKGMVVTYPGKKPCSVRVDQLDRNQAEQKEGEPSYPEIVHFGIRPPQLSYAGNADYQKAWRDYVKFRHLLANMPKPSYEDKRKLEAKENKLQELRTQSKMKRDVTVDVSAEGFYRTGIMCDIVQHAMLIPVLVCHLRFHKSLDNLEKILKYEFKNRYLLQLALTHPSYRENFGTNPDHARNSLTNCGIRQPEYGDRRIHYMNTRKRGINTLINIMSRFGARRETESSIAHNERLEFLGDAVVEFLTSIHLFHMFPDLEEGGLATYRAAIVQNQHLAVLAKKLNLEQYMLYAHGSDLCHDLELRHAMANCFEALMGSLFLDGGIEVADRVFGETLFKDEEDLLKVWVNYPKHPLQEQEPTGDRQWIPHFELLQKLTKFEESIGVQFTHIRLLARAFTDRRIGFTNLTLGSNQRLEFLGDTVLQLIVSEYLYKYFPEHHEGHLSLLRSSLVNNKTQAVVCDDLGMTDYALYGNPKAELKTKDRADLLEAFLGALYVDRGLKYCHVFCNVCFFPRLQDFIMNQDWNDPKSKLQQCCLTLRTMDGGEPDIPVYKVIECKGPTNTRVYTVAVYFQGKRLAKASGHSIQEAEMNSAKEALEKSQDLFPQLDHQKRVIAKSMKMQRSSSRDGYHCRHTKSRDRESDDSIDSDDSVDSQGKIRRRRRTSRSKERDRTTKPSRDRYDSSDRRFRDHRRDRRSLSRRRRSSSERGKDDGNGKGNGWKKRDDRSKTIGEDSDDSYENKNVKFEYNKKNHYIDELNVEENSSKYMKISDKKTAEEENDRNFEQNPKNAETNVECENINKKIKKASLEKYSRSSENEQSDGTTSKNSQINVLLHSECSSKKKDNETMNVESQKLSEVEKKWENINLKESSIYLRNKRNEFKVIDDIMETDIRNRERVSQSQRWYDKPKKRKHSSDSEDDRIPVQYKTCNIINNLTKKSKNS